MDDAHAWAEGNEIFKLVLRTYDTKLPIILYL